jgi:hypothetical protein
MKCPHCLVSFHGASTTVPLFAPKSVGIIYCTCPECKKVIIFFAKLQKIPEEDYRVSDICLIYPRNPIRPLSPEVPDKYASDFKEACMVLQDSPKASAALSRRCLQRLLREKGGVKHSDLAKEIQEVIDSGKLPSYLTTGGSRVASGHLGRTI